MLTRASFWGLHLALKARGSKALSLYVDANQGSFRALGTVQKTYEGIVQTQFRKWSLQKPAAIPSVISGTPIDLCRLLVAFILARMWVQHICVAALWQARADILGDIRANL